MHSNSTTVFYNVHAVFWRNFVAVSRKLTVIFVSEQAGGKAGKDSGKAKAKAVSRSARAGLQVSLLPTTRPVQMHRIEVCQHYFSIMNVYVIILNRF